MQKSEQQNNCDKDVFGGYHPIVNLIYFMLVIGVGILIMHPAILIISFVGALLYSMFLESTKTIRFHIRYLLPMMAMVIFINAAFQHRGLTVLLYLPSGNPLTLESIAFGCASACMMAAILLWFRCYTMVMTSDKFVYLFGRIIPAVSMLLSMILRFIPLFYQQYHTVMETQRSIGRDNASGPIWMRVKNTITVVSIVLTWAMENAIDTADSMKSRGYGLPGRTAFSIYRFEKRDKLSLCWLIVCGISIMVICFIGGLDWSYYPVIRFNVYEPQAITACFCYWGLCITPVVLNWREERKWKSKN